MNTDPHAILPAVALALLLGLAVWHDVRERRIPNQLVLMGALAGLALNTFVRPGAGFFGHPFGGLGFLQALGGFGLGLAILMPMYALRALGAGDVKLMAMVGAFLGAKGVIGAALWSLLAGGLLALAVAVWTGTIARVLKNVYQLVLHAMVRTMAGEGTRLDAPPVSSAKLAYAIAIAAGTALHVVLSSTQGWSLLS